MTKKTDSAKQMSEWIEDFFLEETDELIVELDKNIKRDTPVDTGRARRGWKISKKADKLGEEVELENEVPYIGWLEYGNAYTPGKHFVRKNISKSLNKRK